MRISERYWKVMAALAVFLSSGPVSAAGQDFNTVGDRIGTAGQTLINLLKLGAVIAGVGLVIHGVYSLKESKQTGGNKGVALLEIVIGILLVSIVGFIFMLGNTVMGDTDGTAQDLLGG